MDAATQAPLCFGPYRLAGPHGPLFRDHERLKLKPKTLAVLWLLVRQAGEVVPKTALLEALWPNAVVGEDALAFQIQALRRALDDDPRQPRYIATLHRVGYSFIAPVTTGARPADQPAGTTFVGRDEQLARLHQLYAGAARSGERQLVFVTGEAGIGKTSLVETFLAQLQRNQAPRVGRGQCVEQHGVGEAYLPVLEALGRICREERGGEALDVLRRTAPTWLLQLPALLSLDDLTALQLRTAGASRERMLREVADALETLSAGTPLVLALEDLHWSDPSTIDLLSLLARRREPARLMVLGTCRPADMLLANHPLQRVMQEVVARGQAVEVALGNLAAADVRDYLAHRFPHTAESLHAFVYRRTAGHPLFMVQVADCLAQPGAQEAPENLVPGGLQEVIEVQLGRLTAAEQRVLEVASAAGAEFSVASVAAGVERAIEDVEACCERLVRHRQFIEDRGLATWPDGTVSGRYGFRHVLVQDALYRRLSARQRTQLHLAIGKREEAGFGQRSAEIAAELAVHFERGRDMPRAVHYRQEAGERALQRSANTEALAHFTRGLEILETLPEAPGRAQSELRLHVGSSLAFAMTRGYSAPEVERANARARELCQQLEETPEICPAVFRVYQFYHSRAELIAARALAEQLLRIAERARSPALLSRAHTALAHELISRGAFLGAQAHAEQSLDAYDPRQQRALGGVSGDDPGAVALMVRAWALQALGYPERALATMGKYLEMAQALSLPYATSALLTSAADLHLLRRAGPAVQEAADAAIAISRREGFPYFLARATILRGWALADAGLAPAGIAELRQGLADFRSLGARLWTPRYLGLLAEAYGRAGQIDEGLTVVREARDLVAATGEGEYLAELHRLEGELTLRRGHAAAAAETCFQRAIAVAREQQARLFELRAAVSLSRSWRRQGKTEAARQLLSGITGWFSEGFETEDLRAAKLMLAELAGDRPRKQPESR